MDTFLKIDLGIDVLPAQPAHHPVSARAKTTLAIVAWMLIPCHGPVIAIRGKEAPAVKATRDDHAAAHGRAVIWCLFLPKLISASRCEDTLTYSPPPIEIAPATSAATPATSTVWESVPAAATPITTPATETMPSLAPSTAARSQLSFIPSCCSAFFAMTTFWRSSFCFASKACLTASLQWTGLGAALKILLAGDTHEANEGATGFDLFQDRSVIAMTVNGSARDLAHVLSPGDSVIGITIQSPAGLEILRHSTAHVMAQAVQELFPDSKLGIGPYITDGFYFDFDVAEPFIPEDIRRIEKRMKELVGKSQRFRRVEVTEAEAIELMKNEPYKLELIGLKSEDVAEGSVEVSPDGLSVYENVNPDGSVAWMDLCRGPHLPNTRQVGKNFSLLRSAAAYWRGNENNKQLQRIYGTAWDSREALDDYTDKLEQAAKRDHRKLGTELDLFSFPDEIGSGLAVFHPKGGIIRKVMEDYSRDRHEAAGYEFVYSPHITKSNLFEQSGHLGWYSEGMFPPMKLDSEIDESGVVKKQGADYYLKPMNCPFHILIFKSRSRSYRELPLRMFEFGSVYRYEKSGVLHGLTRVRGMTQDDAHLFVSPDQLQEELTKVLQFVLDLLRDYGLNDFYLELSTKEDGNPKFVGSDEVWKSASDTLEAVAVASGLELVPDPGGAAFYGPKISVQARDAIGRTWQMSTIQLDFNLPERFDLEYVGSDGDKHQPIMIHRALFGSIERFFGVLTEHYAGHFPPWLAPVQVVGIPVADEFGGYLEDLAKELKLEGVRVFVDHSDARMQKKIRDHTLDRVPFLILAGSRDEEAKTVSFRYRDGSQVNDVSLSEAKRMILEAINTKVQV